MRTPNATRGRNTSGEALQNGALNMKEIEGVKLYDLAEVAEKLGVAERTVLYYLANGKYGRGIQRLYGQKIGKRWYISEDNIRRFLEGNAARNSQP